MMSWSVKFDLRWCISLKICSLLVNTRSSVFELPDLFDLVPKSIFWMRWNCSVSSIREQSILVSELFLVLLAGRIPMPCLQEALGKLKSPQQIILGVGLPILDIAFAILFIIILLKDDSRCVPWNLLLEKSGGGR